MALFAALVLSSRRSTPAPLRSLLMGASVLLFEFALSAEPRLADRPRGGVSAVRPALARPPQVGAACPRRGWMHRARSRPDPRCLRRCDPRHGQHREPAGGRPRAGPRGGGHGLDEPARGGGRRRAGAARQDGASRPGRCEAAAPRRHGCRGAVRPRRGGRRAGERRLDLGQARRGLAHVPVRRRRRSVAKPGQRFTTVYGDQRYDYFSVAFEAFEERPISGIAAAPTSAASPATARARSRRVTPTTSGCGSSASLGSSGSCC